jgi:cysteine rich repeat protein
LLSFFGIAMLLLPSMASSVEVTGACLKDAKAQCPGVQAGGGEIKDCLKTHIKDLSDDCKAVLLKVINAKACADDAKKYCADIQPGEGRLEACMKTHVHEVSDACKIAMVNAAAGE